MDMGQLRKDTILRPSFVRKHSGPHLSPLVEIHRLVAVSVQQGMGHLPALGVG